MGSFLRLVSVCGLALVVVGCASDKTRYTENPFFASSRFDPKTTGSLSPVRDPAPLFPKAPVGVAASSSGMSAPVAAMPSVSNAAIMQSDLQPLTAETNPLPSQTQAPPPVQTAALQAMPAETILPPKTTAPVGPQPKIATGMVVPVQGGKWAAEGGAMVSLGDGETLSTLADRYGVPETALRKINGFSSSAKPVPGTRLLIPVFVASTVYNAPPSHEGNTPPAESGRANPQPETAPIAAGPSPGTTGAEPSSQPPVKPDQAQIGQAVAKPQQTPKAESVSLGSSPTAPVASASNSAPSSAAVQAEVERTIATTGFRWPARGRIIAAFGEANGKRNTGIDIALPPGSPVKAAERGVVAYAGSELKGQGNMVMIRHTDGWVSIYAHNSELKVKRGDEVKRGQVIALSGQTGDVPSPQLHFELRKGQTPVDPVAYLADD